MGGSVCGQVVRAAGGAAVPDVSVRVRAGLVGRGPVRTGPDGWFFLHRLPAGRGELVVTTPAGRVETAVVYIFDDAVSELTIQLREPRPGGKNRRKGRAMTGSIRGRVEEADGRPVADASIRVVQGAGPAPDLSPLTDDDGRFVLDDLPAGSWRLAADGPAGQTGEGEVEVTAGATAQVVIVVNGVATPEGD